MQKITERDLVLAYKKAKDSADIFSCALSEANKEIMQAESALIELLDSKDAKSTAKYVGIGHVTLMKPRLFARYNKEDEDKVFSFLREEGRGDIVKETVHASSLSTFVKEAISDGKAVPEYIPYYMQAKCRLFKE